MRGEALSEADDATTEILSRPQLPKCTSLSESPQMQLVGLACPTLARVCPASPAATPSGSTHCVLRTTAHSADDTEECVRPSGDPAPKAPTVVSSIWEATLKPRSQVSPRVTPKGCVNWKISCNFPDRVPVIALAKCVCTLLWISRAAEVYC